MKLVSKFISAISLVAVSVTMALPASASNVLHEYNYDFQQSALKPWVAGAPQQAFDVVNDDTLKMKFEDFSLTDDLPPAKDARTDKPLPNGYAALTGATGNVVWMQARLDGAGDRVVLSFRAHGLLNCGSCIPIAYIGRKAPLRVDQFRTDYVPIKASWVDHKFSAYLNGISANGISALDGPSVNPESVYVAIGFLNLNEMPPFATQQQIGIDDINVVIGRSALK